ncbi:MAG TPA: hypothetical protein VMV00_00550, partial [Candidatus Baltobacteraceae bacterium]|nr:hypothetical protein [Candidatus Baltobacteraceae bacterium]
NEIFKNEKCSYCSRIICFNCVKSSGRFNKVTRLVICKDCWGNMKKRGAFKSNRVEAKSVEAQ